MLKSAFNHLSKKRIAMLIVSVVIGCLIFTGLTRILASRILINRFMSKKRADEALREKPSEKK